MRTLVIPVITLTATILLSVACLLYFPTTTIAQFGGGATGGVNSALGDGMPTNLTGGDSSIVSSAINIMLFAVGVLSVIMLIFGGIRYVVSGGQKEKVTNAKNTILYAIVGLLIAIFANAIIQFVMNVALGAGGGTDV